MNSTEDTGLILWVSNDQIRILHQGIEKEVTLPGRWRLTSFGQRPVAPGDIVNVKEKDKGLSLIDVLPRRNEFTRKVAGERTLPQVAAANIDQVLVMAAIVSPRTSLGLIDRLLVTAAIGGVPSQLILNKCDLASKSRIEELWQIYSSAQIPVHFISIMTREGVEPLKIMLQGKLTLLAGQSGVGKSSLANVVQPGLDLRTGEVSSVTGKGRHVTTSARLHPLNGGGWLIDTPGLRECAPYGLTKQNLLFAFPEIEANARDCKFRNCLHKDELGCGVMVAVENGDIPEPRYETYRKLLIEAEMNERKY